MNGPNSALRLAVTLGAACLVAPAAPAQQVTCRLCAPQTGGEAEKPAAPIRLEVRSRLDFDSLIFAGLGSGAVRLTAEGQAQTSGPVSATGARIMPGSVAIRGEPGRAVRIDLPGTVRLYGDKGGMLTIDSLSTDLPSSPVIGADGELNFRFGGNLKVDGDLDGAFRGDVDILVEYL
jgi:hypothetical protein